MHHACRRPEEEIPSTSSGLIPFNGLPSFH
jgi:hypothetical protein